MADANTIDILQSNITSYNNLVKRNTYSFIKLLLHADRNQLEKIMNEIRKHREQETKLFIIIGQIKSMSKEDRLQYIDKIQKNGTEDL